MNFKKNLLIFLTFYSVNLYTIDIKLNNCNNSFSVTSLSDEEFSFINCVSEIKTNIIKTESRDFLNLSIPSYVSNSPNGTPELPTLQKLVRVPMDSEIEIEILNIEDTLIDLSDFGFNIDIFPNQPSILKSSKNEDIIFYYNESYYNLDKFNDNNFVYVELLGKMRGQKLARLHVSPIVYNPVTNQLKVTTRAEVKVTFKNTDLSKDIDNRINYYSHEYESLFKSCINYTRLSGMDTLTTYPVKYVIISDSSFQTSLQPLIDWKKRKGFLVVEQYTSNPLVGNTNTTIYNFLKDLYNNPPDNIKPTYLLIVGDDSHIPSFNVGPHVSDMYYCEFDGNGDFYPEMYFGRFSANTPLDVEIQVDKTLTHEQYTFTDPSFLDDVVLVAGVDGTWAQTHGNGQINYGTDYYFNTAHGLNVNTYLYASGSPITSDMPIASSSIITDISSGTSFANYTAHCGSTGWSDPAFENADVSNLQNDGKYGLMIGNCCQSNKFDANVCFGEKLLRANNKGALGYIGATNNTYWDDDFWWSVGSIAGSSIDANPTYTSTGLGIYDCWMHENGEAESDWFFTSGQIVHSGNLAVTQAGGAEQYYWEIYHLMGDPSLMPYLGVPSQISVSHSNVIPIGTSTFTVLTEEYAYVALSVNGVLLDAQLSGPSGIVNLSFQNLSNVGIADIVVTKQFKQPYINSVNIISPNTPFVIYNTHTIIDSTGNNNMEADYNEIVGLDLELNNVGNQLAQNISITISTQDLYVNLIDSTDFLNFVNANNTINVSSPFILEIANYVPDQHIAVFDLTVTDAQGNTWISNFSLKINAPILEDVLFTIDDTIFGNSNGKLDAGENIDLIIDIENSGHADISNLIGTITTLSPYININNPSLINVPSLMSNQQTNMSFNITIDPNTPAGTLADFNFNVNNNIYYHNKTFYETVGIVDEDYETGDFSQYNWVQGNYPWYISNNNPFEGSNCIRSSNNLPDNQESEIYINLNVIADGEISFYRKVSSEQHYDYLKFYINNNKEGEWSGIQDWDLVTFPVNAGVTEFKWKYDKDGGWSEGQDCAFIDYIIFPPIDLGSLSFENKDIDIKLFPNPTMGSFKVLFSDAKIRQANVYDVNGKLVFTKTNSDFINFDISEEKSGTYKIKILPEGITYLIVKN